MTHQLHEAGVLNELNDRLEYELKIVRDVEAYHFRSEASDRLLLVLFLTASLGSSRYIIVLIVLLFGEFSIIEIHEVSYTFRRSRLFVARFGDT